MLAGLQPAGLMDGRLASRAELQDLLHAVPHAVHRRGEAQDSGRAAWQEADGQSARLPRADLCAAVLPCLLQRRRTKQAEHMREVERLLAYRRQLYQAVLVRGQPAPGCQQGPCADNHCCPVHWSGGARPLLCKLQALYSANCRDFLSPTWCLQDEEAAEEARKAEAEAREAAVVAVERQRLLREAGHLRGYLPKGVVQVGAGCDWVPGSCRRDAGLLG